MIEDYYKALDRLISNKPINVEKRIVSPTKIAINTKDKKGEIKIRFAIFAVFVLNFIACNHKINVMPISKIPTYAEPRKP